MVDPKREVAASLGVVKRVLPFVLAACASNTDAPVRDASGPAPVPIDATTRTPDARTPDACNQVELHFEARTPRVVILVDRSSSMFERGLWQPLQDGVLATVERLQGEVEFGLVSYTGQAGGTCPDLVAVAPALGNHAAIASAYRAQKPPAYKGETPTSLALDRVASTLGARPGDDYVLLVTDGEPDLCDDGNVVCARDRVLAAAQRAHARGVGTFVFSVGGSVDRAHLQDLANAGSGQPVSDHNDAVRYQCQGEASYGTEDGDARYYEPDVANRERLIEELGGALSRARSCTLDLTGQVEVQPGDEARGEVTVSGLSVPYGTGYRMKSATQLELVGIACDIMRGSEDVEVSIRFPCEALVFY